MDLIPGFLSDLLPSAAAMTPEQLRQKQMREAQLAQAMRSFQALQSLGARAQQPAQLQPVTLPRRVSQVTLPGILG
jgi:hypothetical protein